MNEHIEYSIAPGSFLVGIAIFTAGVGLIFGLGGGLVSLGLLIMIMSVNVELPQEQKQDNPKIYGCDSK